MKRVFTTILVMATVVCTVVGAWCLHPGLGVMAIGVWLGFGSFVHIMAEWEEEKERRT